MSALVAGQVSVDPAEFTQVKYDANEIAAIVTSLAETLGVSNSISLIVDETTPLAKITCSIDAPSSDASIAPHSSPRSASTVRSKGSLSTSSPR